MTADDTTTQLELQAQNRARMQAQALAEEASDQDEGNGKDGKGREDDKFYGQSQTQNLRHNLSQNQGQGKGKIDGERSGKGGSSDRESTAALNSLMVGVGMKAKSELIKSNAVGLTMQVSASVTCPSCVWTGWSVHH